MTGFAFPEVLKTMVNLMNARKKVPFFFSARECIPCFTAASKKISCLPLQDEAFAVYKHWLPLLVVEQQPGVAIRKEIYRLRGLTADCTVRALPPPPSPNIPYYTYYSTFLIILCWSHWCIPTRMIAQVRHPGAGITGVGREVLNDCMERTLRMGGKGAMIDITRPLTEGEVCALSGL
jgi:hypothetical protein